LLVSRAAILRSEASVCAKWMPWLAYQANTDGGSAADPAVAGRGRRCART